MDVLQVIKDEHNRLRQLVVELSEVKTQKQRKVLFDQVEFHLLSHLRIEEEFVYPEAEDCLLPVPESFFNISLENHKLLRKKSLSQADQEELAVCEWLIMALKGKPADALIGFDDKGLYVKW